MVDLKAAQSALLLKQAQKAILKELSPLATNVLAYSSDLDEQTDDSSYIGVLVPVERTLNAVDLLISTLEQATGSSIKDSEPGPAKDTAKETAKALADALTALSTWAGKKQVALKELGETSTQAVVLDVRDAAFNAAMGLQDVFMLEGEEVLNKVLLAEMRKLSGILDVEPTEEAFQAEQDIADALMEQYRLAGVSKPKRARKAKKKAE